MLRWLSSDWFITNLSGYVRDLVLIVFLVTCLEMLAPENAMKRFVQVVAGFMVIVAMLQPLLGLVNRGRDDLDQAAWSSGFTDDDGLSGAAPPGNDAQSLQAANTDRARRLVKDQMVKLIQAEVERARPGATSVVDVSLSNRGEVRAVQVVVADSGESPSARAVFGRVVVDTEPVRPIGGLAGGDGGAAGAEREGGAERQDGELARVLADRLGLDARLVTAIVRPAKTR